MNNTNLNNKIYFVETGSREVDVVDSDEVAPDPGENKEDLFRGEKYLKYIKYGPNSNKKKFYLKTLFNKTLPIYINPYEKNPKEVIDEISSQLKYLYIPPDYSTEFSIISCGKNILNIEFENGIGYYLQNNKCPYIIFKLKSP